MPIKTVSIDATQVDGFKIESHSRQHISLVDQPENGGGTDSGPTPLEYLFIALGGCIITIGNIVAKQRRLPIRNIKVHVEGDLDTDVLMGKNYEQRAGFNGIRVHALVDSDMPQDQKEQFIQDVDARCPISDNILNRTSVKYIVE
jgi:putative redox protein